MSASNGSKHFDEILFTGLLEIRPSKIIGIVISILLTIITCCSAYSIIWFERFGSDLKRIFINKTVSFVCWRILLYFGVIQVTDWVLYFHQPLPEWFCFFHLILRNAIVIQATFLLDVMVITRYIFIFWLKNPLGFQDEFWGLFLNIWITIFRFDI